MTREETIAVLQKIKPTPCRADGKSTTHTLVTIALDMAIKALKQQPCGDCISRKAALSLKTIAPIAPVMDGEDVHYEEVIFVRDLEKLPSVETERKHGHWIMQNDRSKKLLGWSFCSECNAWIGEPTDYCSCCGADMREGQNE